MHVLTLMLTISSTCGIGGDVPMGGNTGTGARYGKERSADSGLGAKIEKVD